MKKIETLREGFTTGAAAAAAAVAARRGTPGPVALRLPDGRTLSIPVAEARPGFAAVVKDGGDDPDATNGCRIEVRLALPAPAPTPADWVEPCGSGSLLLRGGRGVGQATRPGVAIPPGRAAVNPVPRRMIAENLRRCGFGGVSGETMLVEITVPEGEAIARKTLNPILGIVGGISILGTSGIVHPYSHAAYEATVQIQLASLAANGFTRAALVTGSRTAAAVAAEEPELGEAGIIRIGDFIRSAIEAGRKEKLETLLVGCMPGKLFKYACGEANTHAHRGKLDPARLREFGLAPDGIPLESIGTMAELADRIGPANYRELLGQLHPIALRNLQNWAGPVRIDLRLYDENARRVL